MNVLRAIKLSKMGLSADALSAAIADGGTPTVAIIVGEVASVLHREGDLGGYVEFAGEFQSENKLNGERYRAAKMFLPSLAESSILGMLGISLADLMSGERVALDAPITVAVSLGVEKNTSNKGGSKYAYTCSPLIEPREDDRLNSLMEQAQKQISAPEKKKK